MKANNNLKSAVSAVALTACVFAGISSASLIASVSAASAATFSSIEVRGNQRVEAGTISDYLNIKPGQSYSSADLDEATKRLFSTGLFSDVRISQSGSTLIISVDELSVVNQVIFQGNKKIKDAALANQVQLKPRNALDANLMDADAETIREAYRR